MPFGQANGHNFSTNFYCSMTILQTVSVKGNAKTTIPNCCNQKNQQKQESARMNELYGQRPSAEAARSGGPSMQSTLLHWPSFRAWRSAGLCIRHFDQHSTAPSNCRAFAPKMAGGSKLCADCAQNCASNEQRIEKLICF